MDLHPIGRAALRACEGERLIAYRDSVGVLTISVGVTTASGLIVVTPGLTITQARSHALFAQAVERYVDPIRKALRSDRAFPPESFDACCSLAYNIGPVAFAHPSVVRLANAGNLPAAIEAFLMWNKPIAIVGRRQGERDRTATPYAVALPRARRGDHNPVWGPAGLAPVPPPKLPDPLARMTALKPAPTGGLSFVPALAPAAPGLSSRVHALLSRKPA